MFFTLHSLGTANSTCSARSPWTTFHPEKAPWEWLAERAEMENWFHLLVLHAAPHAQSGLNLIQGSRWKTKGYQGQTASGVPSVTSDCPCARYTELYRQKLLSQNMRNSWTGWQVKEGRRRRSSATIRENMQMEYGKCAFFYWPLLHDGWKGRTDWARQVACKKYK